MTRTPNLVWLLVAPDTDRLIEHTRQRRADRRNEFARQHWLAEDARVSDALEVHGLAGHDNDRERSISRSARK